MTLSLLACLVVGGVLVMAWQSHRTVQMTNDVLASNKAISDKADAAYRDTAEQLATICALVNSNLTAAHQGELTASLITLASLRELAEFKTREGFPESPETARSIAIALTRIGHLERDLEQRLEKMAVADAHTDAHEAMNEEAP